MNRFLIGILPFVLTCIPGLRINDNLSIMAYDVFTPLLLFLIIFNKKKFVMHIKVKEVRNVWNLFVTILLLSLVLTSMIDGTLYIGPFLKGFRLFYPSIICTFFFMNRKLFAYDRFLELFIYSMILCPFIGIIGYVFQIDWLVATGQTTIVGDVIFNRASSYWQDATMYGLVTSIFALLSLKLLLLDKRSNNRRLLKIAVILNVIGLGVSFSRSGYLVLVFGVFYLLFRGGRRMRIYSFFSVLILSIILIFLRTNETIQELEVVFSRFDSIINFNLNDANDISSGRVDQWKETTDFFFDSGVYRLFWGYGYKTDTNILPLSDNGFIYTLITTGFIGFSLFLIFILVYVRNFVIRTIPNRTNIVFYSWLIGMCFLDALTYIPIVIMIFLFISIRCLETRSASV